MKKFFKLVLTLLFITTISGLLFLPSPVEAMGGYCEMRSDLTIPAEDAADFGFPAGTAVTIKRGQTVGYAAPIAVNHTTPMWGFICMLGTIGFITGIIFWILAPLFIILGIVGGFTIMTAAGDTDKVSKGKNFILYAAIGFILVLFVRGIPAMIRFIIGM